MINFFKSFFRKKHDVYQIKIIANKDNRDIFSFYTKINISKDAIPSRRLVAVSYSNILNKTIIKNKKFHGCSIQVVVICKLGTFYLDDINKIRYSSGEL